jgi:hypothetical protein
LQGEARPGNVGCESYFRREKENREADERKKIEKQKRGGKVIATGNWWGAET